MSDTQPNIPASTGDESRLEDPEVVLETLGNPTTREILFTANSGPCTATELAEQCGVSRSTIYRYTKRLTELGLLEVTTPLGTGTRQNRYLTTFDSLTLHLHDGSVTVDLDVEAVQEPILSRQDVDGIQVSVSRDDGDTVRLEIELDADSFEALH